MMLLTMMFSYLSNTWGLGGGSLSFRTRRFNKYEVEFEQSFDNAIVMLCDVLSHTIAPVSRLEGTLGPGHQQEVPPDPIC